MSLFAYHRGIRKKRTKKDRRIRRRTIAIDERGDLGTSSVCFTLVATVIHDVREFESVAKAFPAGHEERKYSSAEYDTKAGVLLRVERCSPDVYAIPYRKSKLDLRSPNDKKKHYFRHVGELLDAVFENDSGMIVDIIFDETTLVNGREDEFAAMCYEIARNHGKEIDWLEMADSSGDKILQVHDYLTGAAGGHYEHYREKDHESHELFGIIKDRIKK